MENCWKRNSKEGDVVPVGTVIAILEADSEGLVENGVSDYEELENNVEEPLPFVPTTEQVLETVAQTSGGEKQVLFPPGYEYSPKRGNINE